MRAPLPGVSSRLLRVTLAALMLATAACSTSDPASPTMPTGPSFAGTWVGTVKPAAVAGNLQLTLESSLVQGPSGPGQYSGRWTIAFPDSRDNTSGLASGRAFAALLTLTLQPGVAGGCMITFSGTLDSSATRIDGSISPMSCDGGASTPVTLSKQ